MKEHSIFWPLVLIATGLLWLLTGMGVIPSANLWALTHILPHILIGLGLGLILRAFWRPAGMLISLLIVVGAVLAVVYAPQFGWAGGPSFGWGNFTPDFEGAVPGSGVIKTETRPLEGFNTVSLDYPARVVIKQGGTESIVLKGDDNLLKQITARIEGDELVIRNGEQDWRKRVRASDSLEITLTVTDLRQIIFSSAGTLLVEELKTESLELFLSGAGDITITGLEAESFSSVLSGTGNVTVEGTADSVDLRISGFGNLHTGDLHSQNAEVHISGAGNASLWVEKELEATISGAGSVSYYGDPAVVQNISGAGNLQALGVKK